MQLSHEPRIEHLFPVSPLVRVMNVASNECCLHSHYLATGLHATIYSIKVILATFLFEISYFDIKIKARLPYYVKMLNLVSSMMGRVETGG
jgi:hypothetical protein